MPRRTIVVTSGLLSALLLAAPAWSDSAPPASASAPEGFFALTAGPLSTGNTHVNATQSCFLFCQDISADHDVDYGKANLTGIRFGFWGHGRYRQLGVHFSLEHVEADSGNGGVRYDSLGVNPQWRAGPFAAAGFTLTPYVGLHLAAVLGGQADVHFPEFTRAVSGPLKGGETGVVAGLMVTRQRLGLLVEVRQVNANLHFEDIGNNSNLDLRSDGATAGLVWLF